MAKRLLFPVLLLILPALGWLLAGCASEESRAVARQVQEGTSRADDFSLEVELCRKVSRKSGRRIGVGDEFRIAGKSRVRAFTDFRNVRQERDYTVHLVWIRPDGKELFRKFAEIRQAAVQDRYQTVIHWLDAEDLRTVEADTVLTDDPEFTLYTSYDISTKRQRDPGLHHFRVYLDRSLVLEKPFQVSGPAPQTEADS